MEGRKRNHVARRDCRNGTGITFGGNQWPTASGEDGGKDPPLLLTPGATLRRFTLAAESTDVRVDGGWLEGTDNTWW